MNNLLYKMINNEALIVVPGSMQPNIIRHVHRHFASGIKLAAKYLIPYGVKKIRNDISSRK
ncbi:hypothetical protein ALC53_12561 [Atta colombica]|uniref:Uncharacterized protein n=1 Tax=Atta colombica TaxID=520822 RepID=A0A195AYA4_9HYME|nr:hypothetical protein ALC53_12561 [Atta colombica]